MSCLGSDLVGFGLIAHKFLWAQAIASGSCDGGRATSILPHIDRYKAKTTTLTHPSKPFFCLLALNKADDSEIDREISKCF